MISDSEERAHPSSASLPNYDELVVDFIKKCLGYVPEEKYYLPYKDFLNVMMHQLKGDLMSPAEFEEELYFFCKQIRNDDIKKEGWVDTKGYTDHDLNNYNTLWAVHREEARRRLSKFIGYEPELEYSLDAEIYLRQLMMQDFYYSDLPYCEIDYKAATIVKYREAYYMGDEKFADTIELSGLCYPVGHSD